MRKQSQDNRMFVRVMITSRRPQHHQSNVADCLRAVRQIFVVVAAQIALITQIVSCAPDPSASVGCTPAVVDPVETARICVGHGLCGRDECGYYFARNDADCLPSNDCTHSGMCTARGGMCVVGSDSDCLASELCQVMFGQCTFAADRTPLGGGWCIATSAEQCAAVQLVLAPSGVGCVQKLESDDACKADLPSMYVGAVHSVGGGCEPTSDADCGGSGICRDSGRCHFDPPTMACVAKDNTDCAKSFNCAPLGLCTAYAGQCWQTAADCQGDCGGRPCSFHYGICQ